MKLGFVSAILPDLSLEAIRVGGLAAMCVYASRVALRIPDEVIDEYGSITAPTDFGSGGGGYATTGGPGGGVGRQLRITAGPDVHVQGG